MLRQVSCAWLRQVCKEQSIVVNLNAHHVCYEGVALNYASLLCYCAFFPIFKCAVKHFFKTVN